MNTDRFGADRHRLAVDRGNGAVAHRRNGALGRECGRYGGMLAGDDQGAVIVIVEVGEELGLETDAALAVDLLVQRIDEAEHRHAVDFGSVGDDLAVPSRWWKSRLMRIFLVFVLSTLGSLIGTYTGGFGVLANLVEGGAAG